MEDSKLVWRDFNAQRGFNAQSLLFVVVNIFQVGIGKVVTLFLAWLNAYLADFPLVSVIGIFILIGFFMFLLPPVPGVPVYAAGGVILTKALSRTYDFWTAMVLCSLICYGIKLGAIVFQQKVIGGVLGTRVDVRQMVGVNSISIRAIKRILEVRGFSVAKILILCGGPDWPTSVLTGILGLPLCNMLMVFTCCCCYCCAYFVGGWVDVFNCHTKL